MQLQKPPLRLLDGANNNCYVQTMVADQKPTTIENQDKQLPAGAVMLDLTKRASKAQWFKDALDFLRELNQRLSEEDQIPTASATRPDRK